MWKPASSSFLISEELIPWPYSQVIVNQSPIKSRMVMDHFTSSLLTSRGPPLFKSSFTFPSVSVISCCAIAMLKCWKCGISTGKIDNFVLNQLISSPISLKQYLEYIFTSSTCDLSKDEQYLLDMFESGARRVPKKKLSLLSKYSVAILFYWFLLDASLAIWKITNRVAVW